MGKVREPPHMHFFLDTSYITPVSPVILGIVHGLISVMRRIKDFEIDSGME